MKQDSLSMGRARNIRLSNHSHSLNQQASEGLFAQKECGRTPLRTILEGIVSVMSGSRKHLAMLDFLACNPPS
jgi:hypothetical protein